MNNLFRWPEIYINPAHIDYIPDVLCLLILGVEKTSSLEGYYRINNIKNWLIVDIEDINNDLIVELMIVLDSELEATWYL